MSQRPPVFRIATQISGSSGPELPEVELPTAEWLHSWNIWVFDFLTRALGVNKEHASHIIRNYSGLLISSVTHCSVNPDKAWNYDKLEFRGDSSIHYIVSSYLFNRFGKVATGEGELSMTRSFLVSQKGLSPICERIGLSSMARVDPAVLETRQGIKLAALHEDILEAFIGATEIAMNEVIGDLEGLRRWKRFMWEYLDTMDIKLSYEETKYPKMRVKEFFDNVPWSVELVAEFMRKYAHAERQHVAVSTFGTSKNLNNWVIYTVIKTPAPLKKGETVPDSDRKFIVSIKAPILENGEIVWKTMGAGTGYKRSKAENAAASQALAVLSPFM